MIYKGATHGGSLPRVERTRETVRAVARQPRRFLAYLMLPKMSGTNANGHEYEFLSVMTEITPDELSARLESSGDDPLVVDIRHEDEFADW